MKILIFFLIFVMLQTSAQADQKEPFWVVGSFKTPQQVANELQRLRRSISVPIQIATFTDGEVVRYRLVVQGADFEGFKDQFINKGIAPWLLSMYPNQIKFSNLDKSNSGPQTQDVEYYLILAGYHKASAADHAVQELRLKSSLEFQIEQIEVAARPYYRVTSGPYPLMNDLLVTRFVIMGLKDPWWISRQVAPSIAIAEVKPVIEEAPLPEPVSVIRAPAPGESYVEYCINKANAQERRQFCGDGRFLSLTKSHGQSIQTMSSEEYLEFCSLKATGAERLQYCSDSTLAERHASP